MNETIYQLSKENFHFLMDCINEYWDRSAPPRNGLLYFIKDSLIAERVITKYQPTKMEYFKAFFCNVVLNLHDGGRELNIKEYEEYFGSQQGKKYAVFSEDMNRYLDKQANMQYIREYFMTARGEEEEEWEEVLPVLLIHRLQEVSHQCLKEYFIFDEEAFHKSKCVRIEDKKMESYEQAKRKLYRRFVCAACLYEIFTSKFLGEEVWERAHSHVGRLMEGVAEFGEFQKEIRLQAEKWSEEQKEHGGEKEIAETVAVLGEKAKVLCSEISSMTEKVNCSICQVYFYMIHGKYIMALYAVISMVEFTNVNATDDVELPRKIKRWDMFSNMEELFHESQCETLFIENISMNKNYSAVYKKVMEATAEEKLIQELCSGSRKVQEEALALIYMYFTGVLTGAGLENEEFVTALNLIFQKSLKESKDEESVHQ